MTRYIWMTFGVLSVLLGAAGAVLPLLPTTPFLILAAFCFARSSPSMHDWLMTHRQFGPMIRDWRDHGAISKRSKLVAVIMMAATLVLSLLMSVAWWIVAVQAAVLSCVAYFILTRPSGPKSDAD